MRRLLLLPSLLALALALAACEPAVSRRPLITEGGSAPQPGLWAVLEPDCPPPTTDAVQAWPACATPVWLQRGMVTTIMRSPVRSEFVVGPGEPRVAQVAQENEVGEPRYSYFAVKTLDAPPHRSALVWFISCEGGRGETKAAAEDSECLVEDEAELRRLARSAASDPNAAARAVHIGPG